MSNIKWEDGAVCFVGGKQWGEIADYDVSYIKIHDFQLNEILQGDYIEVAELYTEQKYNDAVEVFGLSGFKANEFTQEYHNLNVGVLAFFASDEYGIDSVSHDMAFKKFCKRKITYPQLMAIGKLKRAMIESEKGESLNFPDDFIPKNGVVNIDGVDVNVEWELNNLKCAAVGRVVNVDDFGNMFELDNKVSYTITKGIRRTLDSEDFELCGVDAKESAAKVSVTFNNNNEILQVECTSTDTNTWPTINTTVDCGACEGVVKAVDGDMVWVLKDSSMYETYHKDSLSKPKSPNEKLIEDLADDLVHQDEHITYLDFAKLLIEKYNIKPEDTYED